MDTLTHALSGALLARATAPRTRGPHTLPLGRRIVVGAIAAAFPDIDVLASYLSPLSYLYHHRGVTHSVLMLPVWAVLLSFLFAMLWRGKYTWRAYVGICAYGIGAHIAGDLITSFGTMIFAPLSDARYALSATFIIDLWFSGIILVGLAASSVWRRSRAPAVIGLAVLAGYVGLQLFLRQQAIDFGREYARSTGLQQAKVTAEPRPVSPFNWTVFVTQPDRYTYAHINLVRRSVPPAPNSQTGFIARLDAPYRPLSDAEWLQAPRYGARPDDAAFALHAYRQPAFAFFRWFAMYPAVLGIDRAHAESCVWFHDLRFVTPGRDVTPFQYGMCRERAGMWMPYQLIGSGKRPLY
jgi:inner membrane protein